jgi:enoyl-[acyl-carrier protein] reductase/trans-2-enoyl-CoA reductase (NAD+)
MILQMVAVMGEDWKMWIDALKAENLLAPGANNCLFLHRAIID